MKLAKRHEIANANKMDTAGRAEEAELTGGVGRFVPVEEAVVELELELEPDPVVPVLVVVSEVVPLVPGLEVALVSEVVLVPVVVVVVVLLTNPPPESVVDEDVEVPEVLVADIEVVPGPVLLLLLLLLLLETVSVIDEAVTPDTVAPAEERD